MRKRHRQLPTGLPQLDDDETELFQRVDQERLERRHAWKTWLAILGMVAVTWALIVAVHPLVGIAAFFLMLYLGKDFNPIPKDERFED